MIDVVYTAPSTGSGVGGSGTANRLAWWSDANTLTSEGNIGTPDVEQPVLLPIGKLTPGALLKTQYLLLLHSVMLDCGILITV